MGSFRSGAKTTRIVSLGLSVFSFIIGGFYGEVGFYIFFCVTAFLLFFENYSNVYQTKRTFYAIGFAVHVGLVIYQSIFQNLPMCGGDWGVYVSFIKELMAESDGLLQLINPFHGSADAYERICAVLYYVFGYAQKYMYFVSFLAAEVCFLFVEKSAFLITKNKNISAITALAFYFTPLEMVYSVDFLREMVLQMFFIISIYHFIRYMMSGKLQSMIIAILIACIQALIHSGMIGVLLGYIFVAMLYNRREKTIKINIATLAFALITLGIFYISPAWKLLAARFANVDSVDALIARGGNVFGTTDYISSPTNVAQFVVQIPIRLVYYYISPLPWQVNSFSTLIAMFADATIRWFVAWRIVKIVTNKEMKASVTSEHQTLITAFLIILLFTTFIFSWGTNNYGTAMRHRTSLYPMELLIVVAMWEQAKVLSSIKEISPEPDNADINEAEEKIE